MTTLLNPYLSFRDNAREAMEFYKSVFGGDLTVSTFADFHASEEVDEQDLVMHSQLDTSNGLTIMASDTPKAMNYQPGSTISISLSGLSTDGDELRGYWDRLQEGADITMPLDTAPWGDLFGMLTDRFGTHWMVSIGTAGDTAA